MVVKADVKPEIIGKFFSVVHGFDEINDETDSVITIVASKDTLCLRDNLILTFMNHDSIAGENDTLYINYGDGASKSADTIYGSSGTKTIHYTNEGEKTITLTYKSGSVTKTVLIRNFKLEPVIEVDGLQFGLPDSVFLTCYVDSLYKYKSSLIGEDYSYIWTVSGGASISSGPDLENTQVKYTNQDVDLSLSIFDAESGCTIYDTLKMKVWNCDTIVPGFILDTNYICGIAENDTILLHGDIKNIIPGTTVTYMFGNDSYQSDTTIHYTEEPDSQLVIPISYGSVKEKTITQKIVIGNYITTLSKIINVHPKPTTPVITDSLKSLCQDGNVFKFSSLAFESPITKLVWYNDLDGDTVSVREVTLTESVLFDSMYVAQQFKEDPYCSSERVKVKIETKPLPSNPVTDTLYFCQDNTEYKNFKASTIDNNHTLHWRLSILGNEVSPIPTQSLSTSGWYKVYVSQTAENGVSAGCTSKIDSTFIVVNKLPEPPKISGEDSVLCSPGSSEYSVDDSYNKYHWEAPIGATIDEPKDSSNITIHFDSRSGFVKLRVEDSNGCISEKDSILVTIVDEDGCEGARLKFAIDVHSVCLSNNRIDVYDFSGGISDEDTLYYHFGTGATPQDSAIIYTSVSQAIIPVTYSTPGMKKITLTHKPVSGEPVSGPITDSVEIFADPVITSVSYPDTLLLPGSGEQKIIANITSTPTRIIRWAGIENEESYNDKDTASIYISGRCPADYNIHLFVQDTIGGINCFADTSVTVKVNDMIKPGIQSISTIMATPAGQCTFKIPNVTDTVKKATLDNCTQCSLNLNQDIPVGLYISKDTVVSVTATDGCGNDSTIKINITLPPIPQVSPVAKPDVVCFGDTVNIRDILATDPDTNNYRYYWSPLIGNISPSSPSAMDFKPQIYSGYHYSVTVTDEYGCEAIGYDEIVTNKLPVHIIRVSQPICEGDNITLTDILNNNEEATYTWYNKDKNSIGTGAHFIINNIQLSDSGRYSCVTRFTETGCESTAEIKIDVLPKPSFSISDTSYICRGGTLTLSVIDSSGINGVISNRINSYKWNGNKTSKIVTYSDFQKDSVYTVTVTDVKRCSATKSTNTILVKNLPKYNLELAKERICPGDDDTLRVVRVNDSDYQWYSSGNKFVFEGYDNPIDDTTLHITPNVTTTINVTVTDSLGCVTQKDTFITVVPHNISTLISPNGNICEHDSISVSAWVYNDNSTEEDKVTYTWEIPFDTASSPPYITYPDATKKNVISFKDIPYSSNQYTLTVTATYADGSLNCTREKDITFRVYQKPEITLSDTSHICRGTSLVRTPEFDTLTESPYLYLWSNNTTNEILTLTDIEAPATYSLTVTDARGCKDTAQFEIKAIKENPMVQITLSHDSICYNGPTTLTVEDSSCLNGALCNTYSWAPGGGTTSPITVTPGNSQTYSVTVTDDFGCIGNGSKLVTVAPELVPLQFDLHGGNNRICQHETFQVSTNIYPNTTYEWSLSRSSGPVALTDTTLHPTLPHIFEIDVHEPGIYTVSLTATFNTFQSNCDTTLSATFTVDTIPHFEISGLDSICGETDYTYSFTPLAGGGNQGLTYLWSADPTSQFSDGTNKDSAIVKWTNLTDANGEDKKLYLSVTNSIGVASCTAYDTLPIKVFALPDFTISGGQRLCEDSLITYKISNTIYEKHLWSINANTGEYSIENPGSSLTDDSLRVLWNSISDNTVTNTVSLTATDSISPTLSCPKTETIPVTVLKHPVITLPLKDSLVFCSNTYNVNLQYEVAGYYTTLDTIWKDQKPSNLTYSRTLDTFRLAGRPVNNTQVQQIYTFYMVTSGECHIARDTGSITVNPLPIATFTASSTRICDDSSAVFTAQISSYPKYGWSVTPTGVSTIASPIASPTFIQFNITGSSPITATVTLADTNEYGCVSSHFTDVTIVANPLITSDPKQERKICIGQPITPVIYTFTGECDSASLYWVNEPASHTISYDKNTKEVTGNVNSPGEFIYVITTHGICTDATDTGYIDVSPYPVPKVTGDDDFCTHDMRTYRTDNTGSKNYLWTINGGIATPSVTNLDSVTVEWDAASTNSFVAVTVDSNNCAKTDTLFVTVHRLPLVNIGILPDDKICENGTFTFTANTLDSDIEYKWTLSRIDGDDIASGDTVVTPGLPNEYIVQIKSEGEYSIHLDVHNSVTGCDSTLSVTVAVHPNPTFELIGNDTVCAQNDSIYKVINVDRGTSFDYTWNIEGSYVANPSELDTSEITINWDSLGVQSLRKVKATVTNNFGCKTSDSITVRVIPLPNPYFTSPWVSTDCDSVRFLLIADSSRYVQYDWTTTGDANFTRTVVSPDSLIINFIKIDTTYAILVNLHVVDAFGCQKSSQQNFVIQSYPVVYNIAPDTQKVCLNEEINYLYKIEGAYSGYDFTWIDNEDPGGVNHTRSNDTISVTGNPETAGVFAFVITPVSTECTHVASDTGYLYVQPYPNPVIIGPDTACEFQVFHYETASSNINSFKWEVLDGNDSIINNIDDTYQVDILWGVSGNRRIVVTVDSTEQRCVATDTLHVRVQELPIPSISGPDTVCETMTYQYVVTVPGNNIISYLWTVSANGEIQDGATNDTVTVKWLTPGSGLLDVTVTNIYDCVNSVDTMVEIVPLPHIEVITHNEETQTQCAHLPIDTIKYKITGTFDEVIFEWINSGNNPNGFTFSELNDSIYVLAGSTDSVGTFEFVVYTTGICDNDTDTGKIVIWPSIDDITVTCPADIRITLSEYSVCDTTFDDIIGPTFTVNPPYSPANSSYYTITRDNFTLPLTVAGHDSIVLHYTISDSCHNIKTCEQKVVVLFPPCGANEDFEAIDTVSIHYETVRIGCDCWMRENLKTPTDCAKDYVSDLYPDIDENSEIFGKLYDWYCSTGSTEGVEPDTNEYGHVTGVCPPGWYLPTREDFERLIFNTNNLKSDEYWINHSGSTSDTSLFNALPGGYYNSNTGRFYYLMGNTYFWTSDVSSDNSAYHFQLDYNCDDLLGKTALKLHGFSVRCIKE